MSYGCGRAEALVLLYLLIARYVLPRVRESGEFVCNYDVSMEEQGRIFAMSVKQAIISRVREAERDVIYDDYETKVGEIVSGTGGAAMPSGLNPSSSASTSALSN